MSLRGSIALIALVAGLMAFPAAPAFACEPLPEPSLARAVNNEGVVGVVERQTVAANPLPWGTSISVVTRIWGGIRADRWKASNLRLNECPSKPAHPVGTYEYDFRGAEAEWTGVQSSIIDDDPLFAEGVILIESEFGPAETFAVGGVDRFMANVRVWGFELTIALAVVITSGVTFVRRRIRRRYDRHLF
jgi:hypothetical protein